MDVVPMVQRDPPPSLFQLTGTGPILFGEQCGRDPQLIPPLLRVLFYTFGKPVSCRGGVEKGNEPQ